MSAEPPVPPALLAALRAPFLAAGATPIDPPTLLPLSLILELSGEAMRERLLIAQLNGGAEMALRPDFTIAAARHHIESGRREGRYVYEGKAYRAPATAPGEPDEHLQIGLEAFEQRAAPAADAETAAIAWRAAAAGGRSDLSLVLGDVSLFGAFLESLGLSQPARTRLMRVADNPERLAEVMASAGAAATDSRGDPLAGLLAHLEEAEAARALEAIWELAGVEPAGGRTAAEIAHRLASRSPARSPGVTAEQAERIDRYLSVAGEPAASLDEVARLAGPERRALEDLLEGWAVRLAELKSEGAPASTSRLVTAFRREFAYYDGVFFEVRSAALGPERPVAAGGRYDGLFGRLGASLDCGAVGCMVRPARAWAGSES